MADTLVESAVETAIVQQATEPQAETEAPVSVDMPSQDSTPIEAPTTGKVIFLFCTVCLRKVFSRSCNLIEKSLFVTRMRFLNFN